MGSVVSRAELADLAARLRAEGKKIVTTNGCFDLLHVGHVRSLNAASRLGDVLIIGLNSDLSVRKLKGPSRPITPEGERAEILCNLRCVDFVTIFPEDTPVEFLKLVKPDVHAKGADYKREALAETPVVESWGGRVELLPLVPDHSTSSLVEKLSDRGD